MLPALERNGINLFAISYDSVAILAAFAAKHGIRYALLSDEGSHTLRRLGLINERVYEDHAAYGIQPNPRHAGVPYPGAFVLDERGVVVRKRFHESYRERDTGTGLLAQSLGILDTPRWSRDGGQRADSGRAGLARFADVQHVPASASVRGTHDRARSARVWRPGSRRGHPTVA